MKILYSVCVPKLLYACEVKELGNNDVMRLNTAVNDAIRKIHTFSRRDSVRDLRLSYGYASISEMFATRRSAFHERIFILNNSLLNSLNGYIC